MAGQGSRVRQEKGRSETEKQHCETEETGRRAGSDGRGSGEAAEKRKAALSKVYRNSEREQRARAERGQSGCEACAQNHGLARRCLSPKEGPPGDALIMMNQVHAIEVGEHGTRFCTTCRGLQDHSGGSHHDDKHAPAWRGVLEQLTCAELGAPQRAGSPPYPTHYVFRPIPSARP